MRWAELHRSPSSLLDPRHPVEFFIPAFLDPNVLSFPLLPIGMLRCGYFVSVCCASCSNTLQEGRGVIGDVKSAGESSLSSTFEFDTLHRSSFEAEAWTLSWPNSFIAARRSIPLCELNISDAFICTVVRKSQDCDVILSYFKLF